MNQRLTFNNITPHIDWASLKSQPERPNVSMEEAKSLVANLSNIDRGLF